MTQYLEELIGSTFADDPVGYIISCLFIIWFIYQLFSLLYCLLGINK